MARQATLWTARVEAEAQAGWTTHPAISAWLGQPYVATRVARLSRAVSPLVNLLVGTTRGMYPPELLRSIDAALAQLTVRYPAEMAAKALKIDRSSGDREAHEWWYIMSELCVLSELGGKLAPAAWTLRENAGPDVLIQPDR